MSTTDNNSGKEEVREEITAGDDDSNGDSNEKTETKSKPPGNGTKKWTPFETNVFIHGLRKFECFIAIRSKLIDKLYSHMAEHEVTRFTKQNVADKFQNMMKAWKRSKQNLTMSRYRYAEELEEIPLLKAYLKQYYGRDLIYKDDDEQMAVSSRFGQMNATSSRLSNNYETGARHSPKQLAIRRVNTPHNIRTIQSQSKPLYFSDQQIRVTHVGVKRHSNDVTSTSASTSASLRPSVAPVPSSSRSKVARPLPDKHGNVYCNSYAAIPPEQKPDVDTALTIYRQNENLRNHVQQNYSKSVENLIVSYTREIIKLKTANLRLRSKLLEVTAEHRLCNPRQSNLMMTNAEHDQNETQYVITEMEQPDSGDNDPEWIKDEPIDFDGDNDWIDKITVDDSNDDTEVDPLLS